MDIKRALKCAVLSLLLTLPFAVAANAQSIPSVERSRNVYHAAVCPGPAAPGTARCHSRIVTDKEGNIRVFPAPNTTSGPTGYYPNNLQSAYQLSASTSQCSAATASSPNGATFGPTIAIVDAYGYPSAEQDAGVYRSTFGLPPCTTANGCFRKYDQDGGTNYPRRDTGWAQEQALDIQMVSAICPCCRIALYEASTNSIINLGLAVNTAANSGATVVAISNSYGTSEFSSEINYSSYYDHPVAITASSGDSGYGVQFPAALASVIAVGGTTLSLSSGVYSETAWSGAGSGCSAYIGKPSWQSDTGCPNNRTVADVSAVADPWTGVAVYAPVNSKSSGWVVFGGTSVASPIIASIYGLTGTLPGSSANCVSPTSPGCYLYNNASSSNINDVISGSNGSCGSYLCTAGSGYDGPTGLGTPKGTGAF